ncbi:unnamed protein product [[Candida] boidinii]|nr:unnamed protein product [[Candida] boidinii]
MADLVEQSKKLAAYSAVDDNLQPDYKVIGIGSGSTVVYVAERIGQLKNKQNFTCIPTGFQSKQLIIDNGLKLGSIEEFSEIDIAFDGADEIDTSLNFSRDVRTRLEKRCSNRSGSKCIQQDLERIESGRW